MKLERLFRYKIGDMRFMEYIDAFKYAIELLEKNKRTYVRIFYTKKGKETTFILKRLKGTKDTYLVTNQKTKKVLTLNKKGVPFTPKQDKATLVGAGAIELAIQMLGAL